MLLEEKGGGQTMKREVTLGYTIPTAGRSQHMPRPPHREITIEYFIKETKRVPVSFEVAYDHEFSRRRTEALARRH